MAQYIDKSALVAEIEKMRDKAYPQSDWNHGYTTSCEKILSFINTLEVKEVDLDFMLHEYWKLSPKITIDCLESATMTKDEMINFAKHFFGLGIKVTKGII